MRRQELGSLTESGLTYKLSGSERDAKVSCRESIKFRTWLLMALLFIFDDGFAGEVGIYDTSLAQRSRGHRRHLQNFFRRMKLLMGPLAVKHGRQSISTLVPSA